MTPRLFVVPLPASYAMVAVVVAIALWRGQWRERIVALAFALPIPLYHVFPAPRVEIGGLTHGVRALTDDLVLLAACLVCVHGARRYWVIWAAAFALLEVVADVAWLMDPKSNYWGAASADVIWSWLLGALLIWAAVTGPRREEPARA